MTRIGNVLRVWFPLAAVVTAFCALTYLAVQQSLRQGANDPQIQMAEDAAAVLNAGKGEDAVMPATKIEISTSLAPFLALYDSNGSPLASSGLLEGKVPDYPIGALAASKASGENRVTWQPRSGVRMASVVVPYKDGYVVAGRSLREVEQREAQTQYMAGLVWIVTLVVVFALVLLGEYLPGRAHQ